MHKIMPTFSLEELEEKVRILLGCSRDVCALSKPDNVERAWEPWGELGFSLLILKPVWQEMKKKGYTAI